MDIFNHFSCYTLLPVLLSDVVDHIKETNVVASIEIYPLDLDPRYLQGFCYVFIDKPQGAVEGVKRAWIGYSKSLSPEMARLVVCKELLHLLDNHRETAQQREQVSELIDQVVLPYEAVVALPAFSDHEGILMALAVMMPRDAILELKPSLGKSISHKTIARLAQLPEEYVRMAFTKTWEEVLDGFGRRFPQQGLLDLPGGANPPIIGSEGLTGKSEATD